MPSKPRPVSVSWESVRRAALAMPGVEEGTSYGTPALKLRGKLVVRQKEDPGVAVFRTTFEAREDLLAGDPEAYFLTDHYRDYPWVLVRLSKLHPDALGGLLWAACRAAGPERRRRS